MASDYGHIGELIRQRREALGWSQAALAERIGTSPAYVSQIESGQKSWPRTYITALTTHLGLSVSEMEEAAGKRRESRHLSGVAEAQPAYDDKDDDWRSLHEVWDTLSDDRKVAVLHYARYLQHEPPAAPSAYPPPKRRSPR